MKAIKIAALSALLVSGSTFAMGLSFEGGKNWTNLEAEMGKSSSGFYLQGNWLKNVEDGSQTGGAGIGYNLGLGPVMANVGVKALYIEPKEGDDGVAFPIGGGLTLNLTDSLALFGEGYVAPEGLNNSVKNYTEANAGVSWSPISLVTLKAGYRYAGVDGKHGRPSHSLYEGPYASASVNF